MKVVHSQREGVYLLDVAEVPCSVGSLRTASAGCHPYEVEPYLVGMGSQRGCSFLDCRVSRAASVAEIEDPCLGLVAEGLMVV